MTKQEILASVFKTLHQLKTTDRMLNGDKHPNKIETLEKEAQELLESNFDALEDGGIDTLVDRINKNAKKAKEEVITTEDIHNEALRVASYIDDTIDALSKIKEMI